MYTLFENLTRKQVDICALVLSSSGLSYRIRQDNGGWDIWVDAAYYQQALKIMQDYFKENKKEPEIDEEEEEDIKVKKGTILSAFIVCVFILLCHITVQLSPDPKDIKNRYSASAADILDGEYFRALTALMLHSDEKHLAGNMAGLFVFGAAVCSIAGWGVGWLMILFSGIAGNIINALMYESAHISIGASTAVFGAIGVLTGYQVLKTRRKYRKLRALVPLAGGLALLGMLGSGGFRVDIMAHLFGFFCGILLGFFYALVFKKKMGQIYQWVSICLSVVIIGLAWQII